MHKLRFSRKSADATIQMLCVYAESVLVEGDLRLELGPVPFLHLCTQSLEHVCANISVPCTCQVHTTHRKMSPVSCLAVRTDMKVSRLISFQTVDLETVPGVS